MYAPFPYVFPDGDAKNKYTHIYIYVIFGLSYLYRRLDQVDDINCGREKARNDKTKVGKRASKFQGPHVSLTTNSFGRIRPHILS